MTGNWKLDTGNWRRTGAGDDSVLGVVNVRRSVPGGPRRAAFTLVELMVVVFIMATMLAVAIPSFVRSYQAAQLNAATRSLVTISQQARLKAALSGREVQLEIDLDLQRLVLHQEPPSDDLEEGEPVIFKQIDFPRQVRMRSAEVPNEMAVTEGRVTVPYYPNGTCSGAVLLLQGSEKGDALFVRIDPVTSRAKPYEVKR